MPFLFKAKKRLQGNKIHVQYTAWVLKESLYLLYGWDYFPVAWYGLQRLVNIYAAFMVSFLYWMCFWYLA